MLVWLLPSLRLLQGQKLSLGSTFKAGALVSSMGKWLDRGLTAMMGGSSGVGGSAGGSGDTGE